MSDQFTVQLAQEFTELHQLGCKESSGKLTTWQCQEAGQAHMTAILAAHNRAATERVIEEMQSALDNDRLRAEHRQPYRDRIAALRAELEEKQ